MKKRLIVRSGVENVALRIEDIALIYAENKIAFVIDGRTGRKYLLEKKLIELEKELDGNIFFRANRKYIVSINFIKAFRPYEKVKLQVSLTTPDTGHNIVISQNSAKNFRKWIDEV